MFVAEKRNPSGRHGKFGNPPSLGTGSFVARVSPQLEPNSEAEGRSVLTREGASPNVLKSRRQAAC